MMCCGFERVSDVAYIDKVRIASTPRWKPRTPDDKFAGNKLQIYVYVFIPKNIGSKQKYPLIVLPRWCSCRFYYVSHAHCPRNDGAGLHCGGSGIPWQYGLRQNVLWKHRLRRSGKWRCDGEPKLHAWKLQFVDKDRVAVVGWSHGGMIALMQVLQHPRLTNVPLQVCR